MPTSRFERRCRRRCSLPQRSVRPSPGALRPRRRPSSWRSGPPPSSHRLSLLDTARRPVHVGLGLAATLLVATLPPSGGLRPGGRGGAPRALGPHPRQPRARRPTGPPTPHLRSARAGDGARAARAPPLRGKRGRPRALHLRPARHPAGSRRGARRASGGGQADRARPRRATAVALAVLLAPQLAAEPWWVGLVFATAALASGFGSGAGARLAQRGLVLFAAASLLAGSFPWLRAAPVATLLGAVATLDRPVAEQLPRERAVVLTQASPRLESSSPASRWDRWSSIPISPTASTLACGQEIAASARGSAGRERQAGAGPGSLARRPGRRSGQRRMGGRPTRRRGAARLPGAAALDLLDPRRRPLSRPDDPRPLRATAGARRAAAGRSNATPVCRPKPASPSSSWRPSDEPRRREPPPESGAAHRLAGSRSLGGELRARRAPAGAAARRRARHGGRPAGRRRALRVGRPRRGRIEPAALELGLWGGWIVLALQHFTLGIPGSSELVAAAGLVLAGVRTLRLAVRLRRSRRRAGSLAVLRPAAGALPLRLALDDDGARPRRRRALLPSAHPQPRRRRGRRSRRRVPRPGLAELHDRAGRTATGRSDRDATAELYSRHSALLPLALAPLYLLAGPFGAQLGMLAFAAAAAAAGLRGGASLLSAPASRPPRRLDDPRLRSAAPALRRTVLGRGPGRPARRPDLPLARPARPRPPGIGRRRPPATTRWELLALALPLVALPLLKLRFLALALPLGALAIARLRGSGRRRRELLLLAAATLLGLGLWNFWRYGNPLRMYAGSDLAIFAVPVGDQLRGDFGLFFDVAFGLFALSPIWLLLLPALVVVVWHLRHRRPRGPAPESVVPARALPPARWLRSPSSSPSCPISC